LKNKDHRTIKENHPGSFPAVQRETRVREREGNREIDAVSAYIHVGGRGGRLNS